MGPVRGWRCRGGVRVGVKACWGRGDGVLGLWRVVALCTVPGVGDVQTSIGRLRFRLRAVMRDEGVGRCGGLVLARRAVQRVRLWASTAQASQGGVGEEPARGGRAGPDPAPRSPMGSRWRGGWWRSASTVSARAPAAGDQRLCGGRQRRLALPWTCHTGECTSTVISSVSGAAPTDQARQRPLGRFVELAHKWPKVNDRQNVPKWTTPSPQSHHLRRAGPQRRLVEHCPPTGRSRVLSRLRQVPPFVADPLTHDITDSHFGNPF